MSTTTAPPPVADPTILPVYFVQTDPLTFRAQIKARFIAGVVAVYPQISARTGGFLDTLASMYALEQSQIPGALQRAMNDTFMQTAVDTLRIQMRAAEQLLFQNPATPAQKQIAITGAPGTTIPGTALVSTPMLTSIGSAVSYSLPSALVIPGGGSITTTVTCTAAGTAGNTPPGAIQILTPPVAGITGITDPYDASVAPNVEGTAQQTIASLQAEYFNFWQNNPNAGNPSQYWGWVLSVPGVGGAVITRTPVGAGSVGISLEGVNASGNPSGLPADSSVVAAVVAAITPTLIPPSGLSSIGPTDLEIYAAPAIGMNVSVNLTYDPTVVPATLSENQVNQGIVAALVAYYASIAFATLNTVQPDRVAGAVGATVGVLNYDLSTLRVNGVSAPIPIARDSIAVHGGLVVNGVTVPVEASDSGTLGESASIVAS